jgi:hypothetical protein
VFLQESVRWYGKPPVSTTGGIWYPYACKFAKIKHIIFTHSMREASLSERFNTLKIEQGVLKIIFYVEEITVN